MRVHGGIPSLEGGSARELSPSSVSSSAAAQGRVARSQPPLLLGRNRPLMVLVSLVKISVFVAEYEVVDSCGHLSSQD